MPRPRPEIDIAAHVPETAWQRGGACLGSDLSVFYPEDQAGSEVAKAICLGCPVRAVCLEYALRMREKFGVWGGTSERERRRIAKARREHHAA